MYTRTLAWADAQAVLQAHWDAVSHGPLKEVIDRVKLVANLWLVHAALKP